MTEKLTNSFSPIIEFLPKLTNYLVGITLLCYLAGFAISNMYLGSLGLVNLDVLRTRYILVGLLFFLFLGAIAYLLYGLFQTISKNAQEANLKLVKNIFWYSIQNLGVLAFAVSAIAVFAGSINTLPVGLPRVSQSTPWSDWLNVVPKRTLTSSAVFLGVIFFAIIITIFAVILINPKNKDGIRKPRKQQITELLSWNIKDVLKALGGIIILFVFIYLFLSTSSLLSFISTNNLGGGTKVGDIFSGGWGRYLGGIALVYAFVTIYLTAIILPKRSDDEVNFLSDNPLTPISSRIYFIALAISIIMPLYANGIYPTIPQQVGGGQVISVELKISDDEIKSFVLNPDNEIYLIDRTSNTTLFLLVDKNTQKYQTVEIANDSIRSIIYSTTSK